jgi:hypothetical protein
MQATAQRTQKIAPAGEPANTSPRVSDVSAAADGNAQASASRSGRNVDASVSGNGAASASVQR